ncbi:hypothetical protein J6T66_03840 [bacterium]|nr:hypothetical protein [bacterium]
MLVIGMMAATTAVSAQEGSFTIPFTNEIGCQEDYDIPTLGEIITESKILSGEKRDSLLMELMDERSELQYDYESDDEVADDEIVDDASDEESDATVVARTLVLTPNAEDSTDEYAIKAIIIEENEDGDIISLALKRNDGWLLSDPKPCSDPLKTLGGYLSHVQHILEVSSSLRLR